MLDVFAWLKTGIMRDRLSAFCGGEIDVFVPFLCRLDEKHENFADFDHFLPQLFCRDPLEKITGGFARCDSVRESCGDSDDRAEP